MSHEQKIVGGYFLLAHPLQLQLQHCNLRSNRKCHAHRREAIPVVETQW